MTFTAAAGRTDGVGGRRDPLGSGSGASWDGGGLAKGVVATAQRGECHAEVRQADGHYVHGDRQEAVPGDPVVTRP